MVTKKNRKGFTLIELLVVIAIIGLLSTLAVVALGNAQLRARDSKRLSDIKQMQTALALRLNGENLTTQPDNTTAIWSADGSELGLDITCIDGNATGFSVNPAACDGTVYMGLIPRDPGNSGQATACVDATPLTSNCNYAYQRVAANTAQYEIKFKLEGATGVYTVGVKCASESGVANAAACVH